MRDPDYYVKEAEKINKALNSVGYALRSFDDDVIKIVDILPEHNKPDTLLGR